MAGATRGWSVGFALGIFMALVVAKLGNPVIFKSMEVAPAGLAEVALATWPTSWGYPMLLAAVLSGAMAAKFRAVRPMWIVWLPAVWLAWAAVSCIWSMAPELSRLTIKHFAATVVTFYLGLFVLGPAADSKWFWRMTALGFVFVLMLGIDQQYGGLEATRKAFMELPNWKDFPPEFQLKMQSNRIFSIFVYPNAFAGAILLWAPALTVALWEWTNRRPSILQKVVVGLFGAASAACLFWTGSKAGWLIAVGMVAVGLLHLRIRRAVKVAIVSAVVVIGLSGFVLKYRGYLEKGATSASARVVYWKAAVQIANANPFFGAGPGTFARTFAPIKPPEAEMARLTHNDYLEQACDSGWPAFFLFAGFVWAAVFLGHAAVTKSPLHFAAWLGVLGWAVQSFVEFGLYIPAISWSAFMLLGWLLSARIPIDTPKPAR